MSKFSKEIEKFVRTNLILTGNNLDLTYLDNIYQRYIELYHDDCMTKKDDEIEYCHPYLTREQFQIELDYALATLSGVVSEKRFIIHTQGAVEEKICYRKIKLTQEI